MAGLDVAGNEGFNNQRKEYLYNKIVKYRPDLAGTADLLYGDLELIYIRFLNDGTIPDYVDPPAPVDPGIVLADVIAASENTSETITRINYATSPNGIYGWFTSSGYGSNYDYNKQRRAGVGSRIFVKNTTGRYGPFGRGAGSQTNSSSSDRANNAATLEALPKAAPGESWGVGMFMNSETAQTTGLVAIRWLDINGASLGTVNGPTAGIPANTWQWYAVQAIAPANTYAFSVEFNLDMVTDGLGVNGGKSWATDVLIEKRATAPLAADYFDGGMAGTGNLARDWMGIPGLSASKEFIAKPLVKRDIWGNFDISRAKTSTNAATLADVQAVSAITAKVKSFGAKGDGIMNDSPYIQAALTFLKMVGGGTLYFDPGAYYAPEVSEVCSNIIITGKGATLMKKYAADPAYTFFVGYSTGGAGYGSGQNNIVCHGLNFKGSYTAGVTRRNACAFGLHHSDNFLAYNNTFVEMAGGGHRFDLQGCRYVTIRDNVFKGYNNDGGDPRNEDIQLDFSIALGASHVEPDLTRYDGLPTIHVTVDNNKWLPLTIGATTYPAANPVGAHSVVANMYHQYITIKNNYVGPTLTEDIVSAAYSGAFHFIAIKDLLFENNIIENNGKVTEALRIWRATSGLTIGTLGGPSDVTTPGANSVNFASGAPGVVPTDSMVGSNIRVLRNTFSGFNFSATRQIIYMQGSQTPYNPMKFIDVDGNIFYNNKYLTNYGVNDGTIPIIIADAEIVSVSKNNLTEARSLVKLTRVLNPKVKDNNTKKTAGNTLHLETCQWVDVSGNTLTDTNNGYDIFLDDGTRYGKVSGNIIETNSAIGPAIRVTGIVGRADSRIGVTNNHLTSTIGGTDRAIEYTGNSVGNLTALNQTYGFDVPITYGAGSASTEYGNI